VLGSSTDTVAAAPDELGLSLLRYACLAAEMLLASESLALLEVSEIPLRRVFTAP
jgi:hypothetical protein